MSPALLWLLPLSTLAGSLIALPAAPTYHLGGKQHKKQSTTLKGEEVLLQSMVCLLSCPVLSCPVLSCPALPCPALPCPALPCPALPCPALPCPALPCPALPCPALPCPALPCPALPCPALPCPVELVKPWCIFWNIMVNILFGLKMLLML